MAAVNAHVTDHGVYLLHRGIDLRSAFIPAFVAPHVAGPRRLGGPGTMTMIGIIAFSVFALIGMPLAFALGFASVAVLYFANFEFTVLAQRMLYAVDSFP